MSTSIDQSNDMASTFQNPYLHTIRSGRPDVERHSNPEALLEDDTEWDVKPTLLRQPTQPALKTLVFRRKPLRTDMAIWNASHPVESPAYFAVTTEWKANTPDVRLHGGPDMSGPLLGVAHFRHSRHVKLGLGDPINDPNGVVWEEMKNISKWLTKSKYVFEFTESCNWDVNAADGPRRRHFMWQRTNDPADGVEGIAGKLSLRNYRLTDQDTGQVVAVFLANNLNSVKKKGELRIFEKLGASLEIVVVLTCASISEKMSRD
ncbi:uncharacterized protein Z518_11339 [Rhinocladiella mackenziei CBS 650.93]|uniref:Uncharacterized protein n=1 Tax=Rhinocladiella mackenziei CBS 650.93 TaxID=1442369 RepID=A0A0D2FB69_9EURO|nr:uncharacterized protein Z518_11339 [Rhinocladiella mackenziei CBS 650.93]KIW99351.1 hypothetical protein Z518_11339 [Rhinocladiella mackenziei CBS 650.93]